jgi:hypothetical protein
MDYEELYDLQDEENNEDVIDFLVEFVNKHNIEFCDFAKTIVSEK